MVEDTPLRVLVIISDKSTYWERSWCASEQILPAAYQILKDNNLIHYPHSHQPKMRLLAKQRWQTRVFLVFDIANTSYDPEVAHLPENNKLPVVIVRLSQKVHAYPANPPAQNKVNKDIARVHNDNGINSIPPFTTDYTSGPPLYDNPRDPSLFI
ncbi:hypothetical protein BDV59DRAFT_189545 [Aspergillus ambiguus]|uniref:uncharacterized protein n=1 Tax=Aspergillus ambiguus TaxID=176160 RepID=UPI003CCD759F